ncbi:MAG TPA: hypothetical protein VFP72_16550, partial [Kineosporiaceae bacterium]|nr:hypothetical protein [Kineosporiaceae bacterium]
TDPTPPDERAHPGPEHAAARTADRVVDLLTARGAPGGPAYNKQGAAVTVALVRAFLDQTLHTAETAARLTTDQVTAEQVTAVRNAHETAWDALLRLSAGRATSGKNSPTVWAVLVTGFVTRITTNAGPQIWTHLHNRLPRPAVPAQTAPAAQVPPRTSRRDRADRAAQAVTTTARQTTTSTGTTRGVKRKRVQPSASDTPRQRRAPTVATGTPPPGDILSQPRTAPLDQAPWLHGMLSGLQHEDSPTPSPGGSASRGTNTPAPEARPRPRASRGRSRP